MAAKTALVKLAVKTPELADTFVKDMKSVDGFRVIPGSDSAVPNLLIYELSQAWEEDLEHIQTFLETADRTEVFILSETTDPQVLIQALRIGVKEFLPVPLQEKTVADALHRFKERQKKKHQKTSGHLGQIISMIGSKGGVGTTTIAVNLADILTRKPGKPTVALMDMNMVFGDIPMFLDISPKHHWGDITKNIERLDEFFLSNILSKNTTGLHVLPSPRYLDNHPMPTPPIMETLLSLMKRKYDFIVIDLGQSVNETALKIIQLSTVVEIVTIQTLPCLSNAGRLIKSLLQYGYTDQSHLHMILNRYIKKGLVNLETAEEGLGQEISWIIPNDYTTTMSAINSGTPLFETAPKSKIVKCFEEYAETLLPDKKEKKGWFF